MTKEIFGEMVMQNKLSLYRVARSILRNDDDCADAIGEAIAKGFEKLHTLKNDEFAKTWLIRILINECYAITRRTDYSSLDDIEGQYYSENNNENYSEDYNDLYDGIGRLKPKQRLAIILYHLEGYSIKEVASIMKTTVAAVNMNLARGRKELRKYLEDK